MAARKSSNERFRDNAPRTYSGLLDDVVYRYPINEKIDDDFFAKAILKNIFFSGDIYINDGYLINHPASRSMLVDEDSILRVMMREGFVRVLSRSTDKTKFSDYPEMMATSGNSSFLETTKLPEWPQIKANLESIARLLYLRNFVQKWPNRQMHIGFHKIISKIFDKTPGDLGLKRSAAIPLTMLQDNYLSRNPENSNPRDAFEKAVQYCTEGLKNAAGARVELMNLANQAYHYNFAMCLSDELGVPIVADTSIGLAFEDLLDLDDTVEAELMDFPLIDIPNAVLSRAGKDFASLLDPSSTIGTAKNNFLLEVHSLFENDSSTAAERRKVVDEAAAEYRAKLAEHFAKLGFSVRADLFLGKGADFLTKSLEKGAATAITFGVDALGGAVGAGKYAGLAIGLITGPVRQRLQKFLLRPVRERVSRIAFDPNAEESDDYVRIRLSDIRPRFASLAFNPEKVRQHVADIPRF